MGSSPPVVVHAPTARELAAEIATAGAELDSGAYWSRVLRDR